MATTVGPGFRLESRIPEIIAYSESKSSEAVEITLLNIERICKERSRVDTGEMRDGWEHEMTGDAEGEVRNNVAHTIYNEYGTIYMSPQPMLTPAVEEEWPEFQRRMHEAYG